jgi:hypothetical protein
MLVEMSPLLVMGLPEQTAMVLVNMVVLPLLVLGLDPGLALPPRPSLLPPLPPRPLSLPPLLLPPPLVPHHPLHLPLGTNSLPRHLLPGPNPLPRQYLLPPLGRPSQPLESDTNMPPTPPHPLPPHPLPPANVDDERGQSPLFEVMETSQLVMSDSSLERHTPYSLLEGCTNRPSVDLRQLRIRVVRGDCVLGFWVFALNACVGILGALDECAG